MDIKDARLQARNLRILQALLAIVFLANAVKGVAGEGTVFTAVSLSLTVAGWSAAQFRIEELKRKIEEAQKGQEILGHIKAYRSKDQ